MRTAKCLFEGQLDDFVWSEERMQLEPWIWRERVRRIEAQKKEDKDTYGNDTALWEEDQQGNRRGAVLLWYLTLLAEDKVLEDNPDLQKVTVPATNYDKKLYEEIYPGMLRKRRERRKITPMPTIAQG